MDLGPSLAEWTREQPLSILQLDPADRAVLRIAGEQQPSIRYFRVPPTQATPPRRCSSFPLSRSCFVCAGSLHETRRPCTRGGENEN